MSHDAPEPTRVVEFPNVELLRRTGWAVASQSGPYCVAFRGSDEVVLAWRDGKWHQVSGRGAPLRDAA
jgi:hypothetical protein